jgi:hypothetical protein
MSVAQLGRCASSRFGSLVSCVQGEANTAVIVGAIALVLATWLAVASFREWRKRPARKVPTPWQQADDRLIAFADAWGAQIEGRERFGTAIGQGGDALMGEITLQAGYHRLRRAIGLPHEAPASEKHSSPNGMRTIVGLVLFAWAAWVLSGPLSCFDDPSRRCVGNPLVGDMAIAGLGIIVAGLWILLRPPAVWMGWRGAVVPPEQTDPVLWMADQWKRLVAQDQEPRGSAALETGASIARAVAEYVELARAAGVSEDPLTVAAHFGNQFADSNDVGRGQIRSAKELPYPRGVVRAALYALIAATRSEKRREAAKLMVMYLEDYVDEATLAPYAALLEKEEAQNKFLLKIGTAQQRGEQLANDALIEEFGGVAYDRDALAPLTEEVDRAKARALHAVEERFGHLFSGRSAFAVWLVNSMSAAVRHADHVSRAVASREDSGRPPGRAPDPATETLFSALNDLESRFSEAQRYDVREEDRETLGLYRVAISALASAARDLRTSWIAGNAQVFAMAAQAFEAALKRLRTVRDGYTESVLG